MAKTANVHARIDEQTKIDALRIFETLGMSTGEAITLFFKQVALKNGIPFELTTTNIAKNNFEKVSKFKRDDLKMVLDVLPGTVDELWVFGSSVTPYCRPDSDLDVCIIGDRITKDDCKTIAHAPRHGMDLLCASHEEFEQNKNENGSIYSEIYTKGLLIYMKGQGLING